MDKEKQEKDTLKINEEVCPLCTLGFLDTISYFNYLDTSYTLITTDTLVPCPACSRYVDRPDPSGTA
jgi:hypothetical protein